jgi:hypothetical protein
MVANFDQSTRKLLNSSKSNPCPVCGRTKDGDCRISYDGKMILCHQNFDHLKLSSLTSGTLTGQALTIAVASIFSKTKLHQKPIRVTEGKLAVAVPPSASASQNPSQFPQD